MIEQPVELVWNKGIARLCDRRIPDEFPDGLTYAPVATLAGARFSSELPGDLISDPARYRDIREGEIVWVRLSWLPSFLRQVLPLVRARFVLVTGDSDSSVPSELGDLARSVLASPAVIRWYAQNHDGTAGERIAPIPIGIDFHMLTQQPSGARASPRRRSRRRPSRRSAALSPRSSGASSASISISPEPRRIGSSLPPAHDCARAERRSYASCVTARSWSISRLRYRGASYGAAEAGSRRC